MPPQRVWFVSPLGLKTCLFSSELEGYVFPGTEYGSECMNSFVVLSPNE